MMLALLLVVSYFLGAIPFAVLVGRAARGIDVRHAGSGNTGALNTLRSVGPLAGVLVALLDAGKAALPVVAGRGVLGPETGALAGCVAVLGHCFSPYLIATSKDVFGEGWKMALRRTGGKGLASGMGVLFAVAWPAAAFSVAVFGLVYVLLRTDVTWPSIIGALAAAPAMWWLTRSLPMFLAASVVGIVIAIKHLPDVRKGFYVDT